MPTFGARLKRLRIAKGMSQEEIARTFGISKGAVGNYERDERQPSFELVQKFCDFFDISVDYLLGKDLALVAGEQSGQKSDVVVVKDAVTNNANRGTIPQNNHSMFPVGHLAFIPIVAEIPCGEPVYTEDDMLGTFPVDASLVPVDSGQYVWLRAQGDSMVDAHIQDGSLVLIRLQQEAEDGEIAAVCIDEDSATLKHFYKSDGIVTLVPANRAYSPLTYAPNRVRVVGVVVSIFIWASRR